LLSEKKIVFPNFIPKYFFHFLNIFMGWQVGPTAISSSPPHVQPPHPLQVDLSVSSAVKTWLDGY
jgi:hypothetical protein